MPQTPTTYASTYKARFLSYQDELLQRLETLINIDSGTGQIVGINRIQDFLQRWLGELNFDVTLHPTEQFGNNLVARRRGSGGPRILLVGHIDTVYPAGTAQEHPFRIRDGVAYGPGVIDMKSGIMLCVYAMRALQEAAFDHYGELCIVFNNDEEVGSAGSTPLLRERAQQADIGLVLESARTEEILTPARKGVDKYILEVHGVAAHSGAEPQKGRSAVIELAHKMLAIYNLHALHHGVTFNITRISSSEVLNIVPDSARCHISVRAPSMHGLQQAATSLEQIAAACTVPDTRTVLVRNPGRRPYQATPEILRLLSIAQQEGAALGIKIVGEPKGGVSDANLLVEAGLPALDSLGPSGGGMHNIQREHLKLESLPTRGALLCGLLQHLCLSESTG